MQCRLIPTISIYGWGWGKVVILGSKLRSDFRYNTVNWEVFIFMHEFFVLKIFLYTSRPYENILTFQQRKFIEYNMNTRSGCSQTSLRICTWDGRSCIHGHRIYKDITNPLVWRCCSATGIPTCTMCAADRYSVTVKKGVVIGLLLRKISRLCLLFGLGQYTAW